MYVLVVVTAMKGGQGQHPSSCTLCLVGLGSMETACSASSLKSSPTHLFMHMQADVRYQLVHAVHFDNVNNMQRRATRLSQFEVYMIEAPL